MLLSELVQEVKFIKLSLNDEDTVKEYGEPVDFWSPDRVAVNKYLELHATMGKDQARTVEIMKTLMLKEDGSPIMTGNLVPPVKLMIKAMSIVLANLGN